MIDTDKYEGHTEGPWMVCCEDQKSPHPPRWIQADEKSVCSHMEDVTEIDIQLIADAPLLLAEVKRLREAIADVATNMEAADASYMGGFIEDLWKVIE